MKRLNRIFLIVIMVIGSVFTCPAQNNVGINADVVKRARVYEPAMLKASVKHRVDPRLLWTIAFLETRFRPHLVSPVGARGLMQFIPMTGARFGLEDPFDAEASIEAAARYTRWLQTRFGSRLDVILAAYNAGEGAVDAYRTGKKLVLSNGKIINPRGIRTELPPYRETIGYVKQGCQVFAELASGAFIRGSGVGSERLAAPGVLPRPQELVEEPLPDEVIRLKQGSLYVVTEIASTDPESRQPTHSVSIYVR